MRWIGRGARCVLMCAALLSAACAGSSGDDVPRATPTPSPSATASSTPTAILPTPTPRLLVDAVFPNVAPFPGRVPVAIEGVGFAQGVRSVRFGEREATNVLLLSDSRISVVAPGGIAGTTVPVSVETVAGRIGSGATFQYVGGRAGRTLQIEPVGLPEVGLDPRIGTTRVLFDYLVRDGLGRPLSPSEYRVRLFVDGNRLGAGAFDEIVLGSDAQELAIDLFLMLVLDASFSLERFTGPKFTEMLQAAENLVLRGADIWSRRAGRFDWSVLWFNDLLARPDPDFVGSFRITNIPRPNPGDFTKLYGALGAGLEVSADLLGDGVAGSARGRHVVVVFTDGRDNLSGFSNPTVEEQGQLTNGDPYRRFGWRSTDLPGVLREIAEHPAAPRNLAVHTVGLGQECDVVSTGACFDRTALAQIAQVGMGQHLDATDDVVGLFNAVAAEFETLKSDGAILALEPGTYAFDLVVERLDGGATGEVGFLFSVGDRRADFLAYR